MTTTLWNLFCTQSNLFMYPGSKTMLEDFACKGLSQGFSENAVVSALSTYYSQCGEVAQENINRAKILLAKAA